MSRILILGATGSLGRQVTEQAVSANHQVSVLVRTPSKLPAELRAKVVVHQADLASTPVPVLAGGFQGRATKALAFNFIASELARGS